MSVPESFYRNAIDLNRFSNSVARRLINLYNDATISAVRQLEGLNELSAPVTAARLRATLASYKDTLATWAGDATEVMATELQGVAMLQNDFVTRQLQQVLPPGAANAVRTVQVDPNFAQYLVTTDPTDLNLVVLSDDLYKAVAGAGGTFGLTAARGAQIALPNGQVLRKAFRGLAARQAEMFGQAVRVGLLQGQTTQQIVRGLIGRLEFGEKAKSIPQLIASGGRLTKMANNQVSALVRTSVNQVANGAAEQVYLANRQVTKRYEWVATLDLRTSAICAALDGRTFEYGKGPRPPQHFNCRSTIVPVLSGKLLQPDPDATRSSMDGQVPAGMSYGEWLSKQPVARQEEALGVGRAKYFQRLSEEFGPKNAIAKMVRDDGSELTLEQLRSKYE